MTPPAPERLLAGLALGGTAGVLHLWLLRRALATALSARSAWPLLWSAPLRLLLPAGLLFAATPLGVWTLVAALVAYGLVRSRARRWEVEA